MAYSALVLKLLVSAPSDVSDADMATIRKAISQWNHNFGHTVGLAVLPISWSEHAAAEFGDRPQALLNDQLVNQSDMAIALFRDRLGTPTGEAASGTAEEIRLLAQSGKPVAVLADESLRPPLGEIALRERARLNSFLGELRGESLVMPYRDSAELISCVNNFLSHSTGRFQKSAEAEVDHSGMDTASGEGVWPRAEVREVQTTDSKGRLKTSSKWSLVLENTSRGPARDVDFRFEGLPEGAYFRVIRDEGEIGTIPPGREARFPLVLAFGSPHSAECVVSWTDVSGARRTTTSTVRTI